MSATDGGTGGGTLAAGGHTEQHNILRNYNKGADGNCGWVADARLDGLEGCWWPRYNCTPTLN